MTEYVKRPIPIEAFKWTADIDQAEDPEWIVKALKDGDVEIVDGGKDNVTLLIKTLEGDMTAQRGDYIIRGIKGEIYPCKPDIFEESYQTVAEAVSGGTTGVAETPEDKAIWTQIYCSVVSLGGNPKDVLGATELYFDSYKTRWGK